MALTPVRRRELAAVLALVAFVARLDAAAQARLPTPLSPYFQATARARPQLPPMPALRSLERRVIKRAVLPTRVDDDLGSSMGGLDLNLPV